MNLNCALSWSTWWSSTSLRILKSRLMQRNLLCKIKYWEIARKLFKLILRLLILKLKTLVLVSSRALVLLSLSWPILMLHSSLWDTWTICSWLVAGWLSISVFKTLGRCTIVLRSLRNISVLLWKRRTQTRKHVEMLEELVLLLYHRP